MPEQWTYGAPTKKRRQMLANSWHIGVAALLISILVKQTAAVDVDAFSPLGPVVAMWENDFPTVGPGIRCQLPSWTMGDIDDMWQHWNATFQLEHPDGEEAVLEPGLYRTLQVQKKYKRSIAQLRQQAKQAVMDIVERLKPETKARFDGLAPHIQALYGSPRQCIQVPALRLIAAHFNWGDPELFKDLEAGFDLIGPLKPGLGCPTRTDERYAHPISRDEFMKENEKYVKTKLLHGRVDPHWKTMATEIVADVRLARMRGPFTSPPSWPKKCVALPDFDETKDLLPGPVEHVPTSVSFAILQVGSDGQDKIRRGEDWRRGCQNMTVTVTDGPVNHRTPTFLGVARCFAHSGAHCLLWGSDQQDAYRQLPVRCPDDTFVILRTPSGPTLWHHHALLFGSTGSVWAYGRCSDFVTWLLRCLLASPCLRYVDDFAGLEDDEHAVDVFMKIHEIAEVLGFRFKETKKQHPAKKHKIQGVLLEIDEDGVTVSPDPDRVTRVLTHIEEILQEDRLHPDAASKLAGKLQFMTESLQGNVMRTCLTPLYTRASSANNDDKLNDEMVDALQTIQQVLKVGKPRHFAFKPDPASVVYADAFFLAGDKRLTPANHTEADWSAEHSNLLTNGWGFVIRIPNGTVIYGHGEIPGHLLGRFANNKAFIYALEIIAQMVATVSTRRLLGNRCWCFCDNVAGQFALTKGFGRDRRVNRLLACYTKWLTNAGLHPFWRRVSSKANISDPISRRDLTLAIKHGWKEITVEWNDLYKLLAKATSSLQKAFEAAECLETIANSARLDGVAVSR